MGGYSPLFKKYFSMGVEKWFQKEPTRQDYIECFDSLVAYMSFLGEEDFNVDEWIEWAYEKKHSCPMPKKPIFQESYLFNEEKRNRVTEPVSTEVYEEVFAKLLSEGYVSEGDIVKMVFNPEAKDIVYVYSVGDEYLVSLQHYAYEWFSEDKSPKWYINS
jgi:hypothetical protein